MSKSRWLTALFAALAALRAVVQSAAASGPMNSGFYDHQIIEYVSNTSSTSSPQEAQLLSHGNIVYHVVDSNGNVPDVQCARLLIALPGDATACNTLNF